SQPWITPARVAVGIALVAVALFMLTRGAPAIAQDEYLQALRDSHGSWVSAGSLAMLYGGAGTESPRALKLLTDPHRLFQHALVGVALLPALWLCLRAWRLRGMTAEAITSPANPRVPLLLFAALSPLALNFIGIDFARWWALALTNLLVATSLAMGLSPRLRASLEATLVSSAVLVWLGRGGA